MTEINGRLQGLPAATRRHLVRRPLPELPAPLVSALHYSTTVVFFLQTMLRRCRHLRGEDAANVCRAALYLVERRR